MSEKLTHWRACDKTDFLGAADLEEILQPNQTDLVLTIAKVEIKQAKVRGKIGQHRIATFKENVKPMIINVHNGRILKKFANNSAHLEHWGNISVTVYIDSNVKLKGELTEGLRFRPVQPIKQNQLTPLTEDMLPKAIEFLKGGKTIQDLKKFYSFDKSIEDKLNNSINEAKV